MRRVLDSILPRTVGSQIVWLIVLAVGFTFGLYTLTTTNGMPPAPGTERAGVPVADTILARIGQLPAGDPHAAEIITVANELIPQTQMRIVTEDQLPTRGSWKPITGPVAQRLKSMGAAGYTLDSPGTGPRQVVEYQSGLLVHSVVLPPPRQAQGPLGQAGIGPATSMWIVLLLVFVPIALFWAARSISSQLRRFAKAAEEFSAGGNHAPLPETGPEEIRVAARALNRMRERVTEATNDRTRMLSAIGHDLRTPVTRLRLRAEFLEEGELRAGMMRDIARMEAMIDSALTFLREGRSGEERALIDLQSLLRTVCDEFTDMGARVECLNGEQARVLADEEAIVRALENLVRNGTAHAQSVVLSLTRNEADSIAIQVDDDGPGIPEKMREEYVKPFVAGDSSRHVSERNFGLGLSITNAIAAAHGGRLMLSESEMGGLRARIILPHVAQPEGVR